MKSKIKSNHTTTNTSTQTKVKVNERLAWFNPVLALILVVLLSMSALGIWSVATFIVIPQLVSQSLNYNISLFNEVSVESQNRVNDLITLGSFEGKNNTELKQTLQAIEQKQTELQESENRIENAKEEFNDGPNDDTKEFKNSLIATLEIRQKAIDELQKLVVFQNCVLNQALIQKENFDLAQERVTNLPSQASNEELVAAYENLSSKSTENVQVSEGVKACFETNGGPIGEEYATKLQSDRELYEKYVQAANLVIEGTKENNAAKIKSGVSDLNSLAQQKLKFWESENLAAVFSPQVNQVNDQLNTLDQLQTQINENLQSLQSKYSLQKT